MHAPRCHPRWSLARDSHFARTGRVDRTDTPLQITVEIPLAPIWSRYPTYPVRATAPGSIQHPRHAGLAPTPSSL